MNLYEAARYTCGFHGTTLYRASGWATRGHGTTRPDWRAVMLHDTVTGPSWSRQQLTALLVNGRSDLPGPIANIQLERNGDAVLIAAGRAYHAGPGRDLIGAGIQSGNLHTIGVEAANGGRPEPWTDIQRNWAVTFAWVIGLPVIAHKEWAPSRKQDPWSLDMVQVRADLATYGQDDTMTPKQEAKVDQLLSMVADLDRRVARTEKNLVESHLRPLRKGVRALLGERAATVRDGVTVQLDAIDVEDGP